VYVQILLIWFGRWASLFEGWEGDFKVVWVQDSLVAKGKTLFGRVSTPSKEDLFHCSS
jgi:hypothetical protein